MLFGASPNITRGYSITRSIIKMSKTIEMESRTEATIRKRNAGFIFSIFFCGCKQLKSVHIIS